MKTILIFLLVVGLTFFSFELLSLKHCTWCGRNLPQREAIMDVWDTSVYFCESCAEYYYYPESMESYRGWERGK